MIGKLFDLRRVFPPYSIKNPPQRSENEEFYEAGKLFIRVVVHTNESAIQECEFEEFNNTVNRVFKNNPQPLTDRSFLIMYDKFEELEKELNELSKCAVTKIYYFVSIVFEKSENEASEKTAKICDSLRKEGFKNGEKCKLRIRITDSAYDELPIEYQNFFSTRKKIDNIFVHDGVYLYKNAKTCFVISPIRDKKSPIRERADEVLEEYIKPACEEVNFRAIRGDDMEGNIITKAVTSELRTAPLVITYLGDNKDGWNANVMYEVGYRMATGLPTILLKESKTDLPFDLKDYRMLDIDGNKRNMVNKITKKISEVMKEFYKNSVKVSPYPYVHVSIDMDDNKEHIFLRSSESFGKLIDAEGNGIGDISGKSLDFVLNNLLKMMPESQKIPFQNEQMDLLSKVCSPFPARIYATYPIVFEKHNKNEYNGKKYLPIIVRREKFLEGNKVELQIIYIEVTKIATEHGDGTYRCEMVNLQNVT
ncbi:MAG: hypothetical protein HUU08_13715 [Candidatus Brocadia sp.]|nr:hypothetical protein [Candidatus Brocadia sp.]